MTSRSRCCLRSGSWRRLRSGRRYALSILQPRLAAERAPSKSALRSPQGRCPVTRWVQKPPVFRLEYRTLPSRSASADETVMTCSRPRCPTSCRTRPSSEEMHENRSEGIVSTDVSPLAARIGAIVAERSRAGNRHQVFRRSARRRNAPRSRCHAQVATLKMMVYANRAHAPGVPPFMANSLSGRDGLRRRGEEPNVRLSANDSPAMSPLPRLCPQPRTLHAKSTPTRTRKCPVGTGQVGRGTVGRRLLRVPAVLGCTPGFPEDRAPPDHNRVRLSHNGAVYPPNRAVKGRAIFDVAIYLRLFGHDSLLLNCPQSGPNRQPRM